LYDLIAVLSLAGVARRQLVPQASMPRGGERPGSGRKKGVANKITRDVRQAIMKDFSILGGAEYLTKARL
jgi:hypothetical protein